MKGKVKKILYGGVTKAALLPSAGRMGCEAEGGLTGADGADAGAPSETGAVTAGYR